MKSLFLISMISVAMILSSCSSGSDSKGKDSDGNCTSETISAHNDIQFKSSSMSYASNALDYALGTRKACQQLQGLIGTGSCKAENLTSGQAMTITYASVQSKCELAELVINPPKKTAPPTLVVDKTEKVEEIVCSTTTIKARDALLENLKTFVSTKDEVYLNKASVACATLKEELNEKDCAYENIFTGTKTTVYYAATNSTCKKVADIINPPASEEVTIANE